MKEDRCISREKLVDHLKERAETVETRLRKLEAWREVQIRKLDQTKKALEELERQTEVLKNVLKDKEGEISSLRKQVLQVKKDGKMEFRNSNAFIYELGGCFADGFNDYLHQVKASFSDQDLSSISIDLRQVQIHWSVDPEGTDELFAKNPTSNTQGNREAAQEDENSPPEEA